MVEARYSQPSVGCSFWLLRNHCTTPWGTAFEQTP